MEEGGGGGGGGGGREAVNREKARVTHSKVSDLISRFEENRYSRGSLLPGGVCGPPSQRETIRKVCAGRRLS